MSEEKRILLHFVTKYFTKWGQNVVVSGSGALLGNFDLKRAHWATCHHSGKDLIWEVIVPIPLVPEITYRYAIVDESINLVKWENNTHTISLPEGLEDGSIIDIYDDWIDRSHPGQLLSTSAFTKVILADRPPIAQEHVIHMQPALNEAIIRFQIWDWELQGMQQICVSGGAPQLGNWQLQQVLRMRQTRPACWEAEVSVPLNVFPVTYKYGVAEGSGEFTLEHGESRIVALPMNNTTRFPTLLIRHDGFLRRERRWRGAGVAVPVFALRSMHSVGCGEFSDLPALAAWCSSTGLRILQLLPVSDTSVTGTWRDSYPYSSICVFALHPMYLSLSKLAKKLPPGVEEEIEAARAALDLPDVDYEATMLTKLHVSRKVFDKIGQETLKSDEFSSFWNANKDWLQPYAVFCFLRDLFGSAEHWKWGIFSSPTPEMLTRMSSPNQEWHATVQYHWYLQYHLHCQLQDASAMAASMGVALKGDLPIGVDKRSVDTWMHPKFFRMNTSTGAPPDYFDPGGQNWGFPTYNWEEMEDDGFSWWQRRLSHMSQFFHAYRIDHILGFFRIWELPADAKAGILGKFRPSMPLWKHELESRGIWDFDRLCEPYVTQALLEKTFGEGELCAEIATRYFVDGPGRRYKFRPQCSSEMALWMLQPRPGLPLDFADELETTRKGLMSLMQNVVLLRDQEDPEKFYPRFSLMSTPSFKELDLHWRDELSRLHEDYFFGGRSDTIWREHALRTLPVLLHASDMLVCGEDLGMIPACVHPVMEELGILGLRIQRMPSESGAEFGTPSMYTYPTVASPSSHDTTTARAWYEEDEDRKDRFSVKMLGMEKESVPATCTAEVAEAMVSQHVHSPSMLTIFPIQDVMAMSRSLPLRPAEEETINDPTNAEHYWRYRMHVTLEELTHDEELKKKIHSLLLESRRCYS